MSSESVPGPLEGAIISAAFPIGSRLVVAVSGGSDSVALLDTLDQVNQAHECHWLLLVAHVNHLLRGDEAAQDAEFVKALALARSLPTEVIAVDTRRYATDHKLSLEAAARALRYRALEQILVAWEGDYLLTAHTADDQAETLIMRLLHGAGLTGLSGIPARRGQIVRPFLGIRRDQILSALQERRLGYRLDGSNSDERHWRNRVRRVVLPALDRESPGLTPRLARTAALLRADADYLHGATMSVLPHLGVQVTEHDVVASAFLWRALHPSLQRSVLRALLGRHFGLTDMDAGAIERACAAIRGEIRIPLAVGEGVVLDLSAHAFRLSRGVAPTPPRLVPGTLDVPGVLETAVGVMTAERLLVRGPDEFDRLRNVCSGYHALCAADVLGTRLSVRSRVPGDRVRPLGMGGSRKVQDVLVDRRAPAAHRDRIPIVENVAHIVWLPGVVVDERAAAHRDTEDVILLSFRPLTGPMP